jgi:hypothetical protein
MMNWQDLGSFMFYQGLSWPRSKQSTFQIQVQRVTTTSFSVYFTDTLILGTILRYFVLKKYNAVMSSMEYFMFVDEVT